MRKLTIILAIVDAFTTLISQHDHYWTAGTVNENFIWSRLALEIHPLFFVFISIVWWAIIWRYFVARELLLVSFFHLGGILTWLFGWSVAWSIAVPVALLFSLIRRYSFYFQ